MDMIEYGIVEVLSSKRLICKNKKPVDISINGFFEDSINLEIEATSSLSNIVGTKSLNDDKVVV
jgi:hypothetical protein